MRLKRIGLNRWFGATVALFVLCNIWVGAAVLGPGGGDQLRRAVVSYVDKGLDLPGIDQGSWVGSAKRTARSVLRVVPNWLRGDFPATLDGLRIDVKFKHLRRLRDDRTAAIKLGMLLDSDLVPATIAFGGREYRARIRLKGDFPDHWDAPDRWSLRVRLRDGATLFGMRQFSLHKPTSRQIPDDMLFERWIRAMGNLAPRYAFTRVTVNGDYWGVMGVEEHMTGHFAEMAERVAAPIFKFVEEDEWAYGHLNAGKTPRLPYFGGLRPSLYERRRNAAEPRHRDLYGFALDQLRRFRRGELPAEAVFDIPAFARVIAASAAWGSSHATLLANLRFYVDPFSLRIEPVTTDQQRAPTTVGMALDVGWPRGPIFDGIVGAPSFPSAMVSALRSAKAAFPEVVNAYADICRTFPLDCPDMDLARIEARLAALPAAVPEIVDRIRTAPAPNPTTPADAAPPPGRLEVLTADLFMPTQVMARYETSGALILTNLVGAPVRVDVVRTRCAPAKACDNRNRLAAPLDLPPTRNPLFPAERRLAMPPDLNLGRDMVIEIESRFGKQLQRQQVEVAVPGTYANPLRADADVAPGFVERIDGGLRIPAGDWRVDTPIVTRRGGRLVIDPGARLAFAPDAYILARGPLAARGEPDRGIELAAASADGWPGLLVLDAGAPSEMAHVTIRDTRGFAAGLLRLTGGVTFYRSDLRATHTAFIGSRAEDALNVVRARFDLTGARFRDTRSDALDADFADGVIRAARFDNIGGDALDTAGARVEGADLSFANIYDKALSIGEGSRGTFQRIAVDGAGAGAVAKDGSALSVDGLTVARVALFAGMAYEKKSGYGRARLEISGSNLTPGDVVSQTGSVAVLDGATVAPRDLDVDALYASGPMRKAKTGN